MHVHRVAIAATDPISLCDFYVETLGFASVPGAQRSVTAGETTLWFELGDTDADHLAFTVDADVESVIEWLDERVDILETDEGSSIRFDFMEADSVYFEDPEGNVIEYVCYDGQSSGEFDPETDIVGVTEVGMAVPDVASFVSDLTAAIDVDVWSEFGDGDIVFVGDQTARFVVSAVGRPWYPTDRAAAVDPVSVQCDADGSFDPEGLPYRVNVQP
ncbi:VOC family protein [Haloferax sp. MBLA0076]|uniref:VOC family protein n=1 Tax=Haloferax litoreum TaxID=2666140 RepID=A0A6A8GDH8_9EURY|nr:MULTISPECIES: VOC family protein [Haloferax]KAB1192371.1 VOC family protein [Haloferax sp. CBA1148]MRX20836.1 VOC family protein [Haloferax litoreum]